MYLRLLIAYDGTDFAGFQKQPNRRTVQGELEHHLQHLLGPGTVYGASRTDAGVHARGQVVVWTGRVAIPIEKIVAVMNRRLPSDLVIRHVDWVPETFRPTYDAQAKYYSYRIWRGSSVPWPGTARYVAIIERSLSWVTLNQAARLIVGQHDFWAFRSEGSSAQTTIRHVFLSKWTMEDEGNIWRYDIGADGFLYHMVRRLVGAMILCAERGDISLIYQGLEHPRSAKVGFVAPAKGLILERIDYDNR
ncbi:tRNA pseudouridine(38-40) synthase TruA [Sulfobacillus thermosulfidooxidans]|uniref:tRNA pseudouridine(38-40) synthase TruA n=1 Tax=Sulfobacillus thermosulfidooxidans TaxID=28034 RepID=UPI00031734C5|nr:tRNA pseudouridine(38-40) synthase TruA [Sulfobacillus thermosulfidooxidans]